MSVLSFNFLFTELYYTLLAYRADYPITFFIMLIVAIITSTLMSNVKEEAMIANLREKRIEALYRSNRKLLQAENKKQVTDFSGESLVKILNKDVMICLAKDNILEEENIYYKKNTKIKDMFISYIDKEAMKYSFNQKIPCGLGTNYYKNIKNYYYPIKGQNKIIGINLNDENRLTNTEKILLESISVQTALAIERENLFEKNRKVSLEAERERLRGNLLRSISHDLRTPLTSILGSVSTIIDNNEVLDGETKKELLKNIYDDTVWISQSFENILSMTRIDEGRLKLNKKIEIVDEIVVEAVSRVKKFSKSHNINLSLPEDIILINADGLLIEQVLVNLIQNAVRYTPKNSNINIKIIKDINYIAFEVEDNGCGISKENIENIFERFYTKTKSNQGEQRGIGLGLAICK
ncbi:ATP-binding protein [Romboutsia lituseburensis]|nr:ATP-binding protein [Romboutsia lituseburensis]